MIPIASLLNPGPPSYEHCHQLPSPCPSKSTLDSSTPPLLKKHKMPKDGAIFTKGKVQGEIRYQPCEFQDEEIAVQHRQFKVYPMGKIAEYCRHIPYNSEKKTFLEKTGRESFEVFQYTFKVPGDEREYTVMWDYNIGLVRMTPFFRCCGFSKTTPAKMLNSNPGLREICHSITGGALAAQGYWMPFEAAKAVAATFCYEIRYALTPIFGIDFISLCTAPGKDSYKVMVIDRDIVQRCTETANRFRALYCGSSHLRSPETPSSSSSPRWSSKSLRPKLGKSKEEVEDEEEEEEGEEEEREEEKRYDTDEDKDGRRLETPMTVEWTPMNIQRPTRLRQHTLDDSYQPLTEGRKSRRGRKPIGCSKSSRGKRFPAEDQDYDRESLSIPSADSPNPQKRRRRSSTSSKETLAAYMLLQMHMADARLGKEDHRV